jgi:hypothetical protein
MTRRSWEKFVCRCIFRKAYPEIKLTTVTGIGTQLMQRIMVERRGEKFIPDIYIAGIATMTVLNQAKIFDPIKPTLMLAEVIDESKWWKGKHLYGDAERTNIVTFAKNPDYGSIVLGFSATEKENQDHSAGSSWRRSGDHAVAVHVL